jgi:hypothetical protein
MKGHKAHHHRKHKADGGKMDSPAAGDREYEQDLKSKNQRYTYQSHVNDEAEERKRGGRAKKHVGKVHGHHAHHAGRKARKAGGRAGSDKSPLSSAHAGTPPRGHKDVEID